MDERWVTNLAICPDENLYHFLLLSRAVMDKLNVHIFALLNEASWIWLAPHLP